MRKLHLEGPPGYFGEQGNKRTKQKNRLGNRGTNTNNYKALGLRFLHKRGVIGDFLLFSDFFGKFLFPSFESTGL